MHFVPVLQPVDLLPENLIPKTALKDTSSDYSEGKILAHFLKIFLMEVLYDYSYYILRRNSWVRLPVQISI